MITFLFWNMHKRPLKSSVVSLASSYNIDIIMLAECLIHTEDLLICLNSNDNPRYFHAPTYGFDKIKIFIKFPNDFIKPVAESNNMTIQQLKLPGRTEILLGIVHLHSKRYMKQEDQDSECVTIIQQVEIAEKNVGHSRTILVGDFNMNPFEPGIVKAGGLHAIMSKKIAKKGERIIFEKIYKFFYNPMWGFFGDDKEHPPGTYYYDKEPYLRYYWNIYDQLLIRPELIDRFNSKELRIIDSDGENMLIKENGIPDKDRYSDHLPILFKLSL